MHVREVRLEDAKVETTLAASAQFLDLDKCIAFSSGSPIFFPKLSLTSSFSVIDNSTISKYFDYLLLILTPYNREKFSQL